ncbi:MAG: hypothetical protein JSV24_07790 [Bacteroidales bacterium]|nr:MAG: hypothetical protein JSV24_07790 [Bacteroidales bacterium]
MKFELSFTSDVHTGPVTGRAFIMLSETDRREPRFMVYTHGIPFFGSDIENLNPGEVAIIDCTVPGYPVECLADIPAGEYYVQGFINIYTEFNRSDGHTLWLHNDRWEGQRWNVSPGNIYSEPMKIRIDHSKKETVKIRCDNTIPPVEIPPDTEWVKRIKFESRMLTEFWGQPIYLGATILVPKGYYENPDGYYPVNYIQGHFSLSAPNGFRTDDPGEGNRRGRRGYEFYRYWISEECPRMFLVTFQHPCPYYDDSYAVNSPNTGSYGDAIIQELIPYLEEHFRMIPESWARLLTGGSTGGWISLALQAFNPDFFGGTWSLCPDPVDFRFFQTVNIYEDKNAFFKEFGWVNVPTSSDRSPEGIVSLTFEQRNRMERVMGTRNRSGEQIDIFEAAFGPVGPDGYTKSLFDPVTGEIDPEVAAYWKEHYDLRAYLERNWPEIGHKLAGKIHIYTGDMDTYYLNNAVVLLEQFLESTTDPYYGGTVEYGDRQPHCWGPRGEELLEMMAEHISNHSPSGTFNVR